MTPTEPTPKHEGPEVARAKLAYTVRGKYLDFCGIAFIPWDELSDEDREKNLMEAAMVKPTAHPRSFYKDEWEKMSREGRIAATLYIAAMAGAYEIV